MAQQETLRAAEYAKENEGYFDQMDATNRANDQQKDVQQYIEAAQSSGDLGALQAFAEAAREAADAAREAAIATYDAAMLDGQLSEEEEKLLDAMKAHAEEQEAQAPQLSRSVTELQKDAQHKGAASASGYDAQAVVSKAMAQAMRNDKSLGYQKDTAEGIKKLIEVEQAKRENAIAFS